MMIDLFKNDALGKLILRLTVGVLMLFHGVSKLINTGSLDFIAGRLVDIELPSVLVYGVYAGEVIAPLMIIFGVFARIGGLLIAVNMLFAIVLAHLGDLVSLTEHGGYRLELQAFYLFCSLAIVFLGSGRMAVKPD